MEYCGDDCPKDLFLENKIALRDDPQRVGIALRWLRRLLSTQISG
jgi:hypothetical protein